MTAITTHVLDTARGRPAAGVPVRLERTADGAELGRARTDGDGRVRTLGPRLEPGSYRLVATPTDDARNRIDLNGGSITDTTGDPVRRDFTPPDGIGVQVSG